VSLDTQVSRDILSWTRKIIDACGARPAGSERCRRAAELIVEDLKPYCTRTQTHEFECRPWSFIWQGAITTPVSIVASGLLFFGHLWLASGLFGAVALVALLEFGLYREAVDALFPRRRCTNVVGVLEPNLPAVRQIVVSAHHDSAYEFRYVRLGTLVYSLFMLWYSVVTYAMPFLVSGLAVAQLLGVLPPMGLIRGLALFSGAGGLLTLGFVDFKAVPGAGDNLVSTGMLVELARTMRAQLDADPQAFGHTRVLLVSFDAEESGLRGSRAFVRDHRALLRELPTVNLNLESFFDVKTLAVLVTDLNGTVKLSEPLARMLEEEATAEGLELEQMKMRYGFGATDAAEFARAGIPATTLLAVPHTPLYGKRVLYHTRDDLPENLDPAAVEAGARLVRRMVERLSREGDPRVFEDAA